MLLEPIVFLSLSPLILPIYRYTPTIIGAEVTLPNFVNALEGGTSQVCVSISPFFIRERDVVVMLTLIPNSQFVSKCPRFQASYH